jgi:hypothetical protein
VQKEVRTFSVVVGSCKLIIDRWGWCDSGSTLKTAFASVHELSVHVHERCAGTVHVHVRFVPENSCCTVVHG